MNLSPDVTQTQKGTLSWGGWEKKVEKGIRTGGPTVNEERMK